MVSAKYLVFLLVAGVVAAEEAEVISAVEEHARQAVDPPNPVLMPGNPNVPVNVANPHWSEQVRDAVNGASERLSNNMVVVLTGLSETMRVAGVNNTRAFAILTRGIVTNVVDLTNVVAYLPRLFLLDLPNQFTEVLRLVRRNEVRVPSSINEAIDSILVLTRQAEESGITQRVFGPVVRIMPNILNGVHDFLQQIFTTMFTTFGVSGLPEPILSPIPSRAEGEMEMAPAAPAVAAPNGRHYYY